MDPAKLQAELAAFVNGKKLKRAKPAAPAKPAASAKPAAAAPAPIAEPALEKKEKERKEPGSEAR